MSIVDKMACLVDHCHRFLKETDGRLHLSERCWVCGEVFWDDEVERLHRGEQLVVDMPDGYEDETVALMQAALRQRKA